MPPTITRSSLVRPFSITRRFPRSRPCSTLRCSRLNLVIGVGQRLPVVQERDYFSWLEMLVNVALRLVPRGEYRQAAGAVASAAEFANNNSAKKKQNGLSAHNLRL